jgi:PAS domain S-box-containing protein
MEKLRILILEDVEADYELLVRQLKREKLYFEPRFVRTKKDFFNQLASFIPDVIISDYKLSGFDGMEALALAKDLMPDVPFIISTGSINEETAVECMKAGAMDYVLKDRLKKIGQIVLNAVEGARVRRGKALSEQRLAKLNECFLSFSPDTHANIKRLIAAFGEMLDADCALYNRLEEGLLCARADWRMPEGYNPKDRPDGHICYDVIQSGSREVFIVQDLQATSYAKTDPNVKRYNLKTYIGMPVFCGKKCVGSLCAVYKRDVTPTVEDRKVIGVFAAAVGVEEERARDQEIINNASRQWQMTFDAVGDSIMVIDNDYRVLKANEATYGMLGCSLGDLSVKKCWQAVHKTAEPPDFCPVKKMRTSGKREEAEVFLPEDKKWLLITVDPIKDRAGKILGAVHITKDISRVKRAEQMLITSEERYKQVSLVISDFAYSCLHTGEGYRIDWITDAFYSLSGYTADELFRQGCWMFTVHPDDAEIAFSQLKELSPGIENVREFRIVTQDGRIIWISNHVKCVSDKQTPVGLRIYGAAQDITESKKAEAALRESQRLILEIERLGQVGGWEFNIDTEKQTWTQEVYSIHEVDPSYEPTVEKGINFYTPESREIIQKLVERTIEHGEPFDVELEIITAKGNRRSIHTIGRPDLAHRRVFGFFQDITDRKKAEEDLRQSEERLRSVLDATPFPVAMVDVQDSTIDYWSKSAHAFFGHTVKNVEEWYTCAYPDPDYRRAVIARWKHFLEQARVSKKPVNTGEYRVACRDGSVRVCELYAMFLADRLVVTFNDITERKRAEEALAFKTMLLEAESETSLDGILVVDDDGQSIMFNKRFGELWKIPRDILEETDDVRKLAYVSGQMKDPEEFLSKVNHLYVHKDEESRDELELADGRFFDRYSSPLIGVDGKHYGRIWYFRDITDRKKAEAALQASYDNLKKTQTQLLQSEKMASVGVLAAGVAHEINNPTAYVLTNLNVLKEYIEKIAAFNKELRERIIPPEKKASYKELSERLDIPVLLEDMPNLIKETHEGTERIKKIVQDLRLFSRADPGVIELVDINNCIESTLDIIKSEIRYKAELIKEYGEVGQVSCNPNQISQVFLNILVNAAQSIEKYGKITIRTYEKEKWACIELSDTGSGIPPDQLQKIFDPFFSTKAVGKGTGLGLSIVQGIVEKHNGTIEVKSTVGQGTTFIIRLPVK